MAAESEKSEVEAQPNGDASKWAQEIKASNTWLKKWHDSGDKVVKRYLDERDAGTEKEKHWVIFTSNVQTQMAMMYGQTPPVTVGRRFSDAQDDVARVAGVMLERLLNTDIQSDDDPYEEALQNALEDFFLPGLGMLWARYEVEHEEGEPTEAKTDPVSGKILAPAVPAIPVKSYECVELDYVHWRDLRWSPCRTFSDLRWMARRAQMTREELVKRFGDKLGKAVPLNTKKGKNKDDVDGKQADPWGRADVWEIWDKESKQVCWYVEGYPALLDTKADPLGLDGFWPFDKPLVANTTTTAFIPKPTYSLTQDLYAEVDSLTTKIDLLVDALKVAGVYDAASPEIAQILTSQGNKLIPVKGWASLSEAGGLRGKVDWFPLEQVVAALAVLRDVRKEQVDAINQLTGMSDIMRGQAMAGGRTATETRVTANFGSVRMQRIQNEFARFASGAQRIKAQIIAKHFDVQTIIERSNILRTPDAALAQQAAELIKSDFAQYRIEVKSEAISLTDFTAQKQDAAEFVGAMSTFIQSATPLAQAVPGSLPFLLKMMQWSVAKFRGAAEIEGVLDEAIDSAEKQAQQPQQPAQEDPKLAAIRAKGQVDIQKAQLDSQLHREQTMLDVQAEEAKQKAQTEWNVRERVADAQIKQATMPKPMPFGGQQR